MSSPKRNMNQNRTLKQKKGRTQPKGGGIVKPVPVPTGYVPVNLYVSKCCNALGKKKPNVRLAKDREANKFSENGLGVFRCSACNKHSQFNRQPNTKGESISF